MYTLEIEVLKLKPRHISLFHKCNLMFFVHAQISVNGNIDLTLTGTKTNLIEALEDDAHGESNIYFDEFAKPYLPEQGQGVIVEDPFKVPHQVTVDIVNEPDDTVDYYTFVDTEGIAWRISAIIHIM